MLRMVLLVWTYWRLNQFNILLFKEKEAEDGEEMGESGEIDTSIVLAPEKVSFSL